MTAVEGIFSLRIVTADFYMEKPKPGLDPCFSDFRAKEIKKVPIIRIFGSSAEGQKTCMHIHGVFPYLYIPYDKQDFESVDKAMYLVASSIDKAINISLGQGSSGSLHVFKIQLVKGIPFYGYHQKEHQYLKVYMLNPRFIRRTANLLQNGAILGKIFQPHESHVPYILQFFIDYNLYGMSFLHVPREVMKFRRKNEKDEIQYPVKKEQILDYNVAEKQSTSQLELDIASGFILNRFQLLSKASEHTNPGIESIWQDERVRRLKLKSECEEVPPLEIPVSQERPDVKPTESHQFYHVGLISRLQQLEESMDQTLNATLQSTIVPQEKSAKEKKRTFNLQKLIANAVYPEECTQHDNLTNASFIEDHLSSRSAFHTSAKFSETPSGPDSDDVFLDDTVVDEELILSLTQPEVIHQSLREEDMALLEVLQQLEEKEDGGEIDLDSTLAPLSQNLDLNSPQATVESALIGRDRPAAGPPDDDSDNECLDNYSIVMDDMDELLLKLSQNSQASVGVHSIAQCDGSDDILLTPKRNKQRKLASTPSSQNRNTSGSPKTPRTPKSVATKYASLPLVIKPRSLSKALGTPDNKDNDDEAISESSEDCQSFVRSARGERKLLSLRKELAITKLRRKSISTDKAFGNEDENTLIVKRKRKTSVDLDKTHITCSLRACRKINDRRLKVYTSADVPESPTAFCNVVPKNTDSSQPDATANENSPDLAKENPTNSIKTDKISPRILLKKCRNESISPKKSSTKITQNSRSPRVKLKRWSPATPEKLKQSISTNQISPKVLLCRSPRIKKIISTENELGLKRKTKRRTRLSLSLHRKIRKEKEWENIKYSLDEQSATNANDSHISDSEPDRSPKVEIEHVLTHKSMKKVKVRLKKVNIEEMITHVNSPKTPIAQNKLYPQTTTGGVSRSLIKRFRLAECSSPRTPCGKGTEQEFGEENCNSVHSFYEKSFVVDSPVFSDLSVPSPMQGVKSNQSTDSPCPDRIIIITPQVLPETYQEVEQNFEMYGIPDMVHQQPFYSSYTDVTHKKEVGHTVLRIPSMTLHDVEEFQSTISNLVGFSGCRKQMMQLIGGSFRTDDHFREYLSTERAVCIEPCRLAPTKQEAKVWLAARDVLQGKNVDKISNREEKFAEDSPIKIRRQKVVMLMENESGGSSEDMDCSMRSMSLTPLTPMTNTKPVIPKSEELFDQTPLIGSCSGKKSERRRSLKAKKSLSQKLKDICITNALEQSSGESIQPVVNCVPADRLLKIKEDEELRTSQESSKSNETVTSEAVLAELNKSSFIKNLHSSQGSLDTSFGLSMATLNNTYGFKVNLENLQQAKADVEHNYLTTLSLELFIPTRDDLLPNPQFDSIMCIFYTVENSIPSSCTDRVSKLSGFVIISDSVDSPNAKFNGIASDIVIDVVTTELEGLHKFLELCGNWDPDIFVGYEIEMSSWGYLMERAKFLDFQIAPLLSRIPSQKVRDFIDEDRDQLTDLEVETKLCGRILLDVWRLMRSEIALTSYTFENVMYHILHRRYPLHVHKDLTQWFQQPHTRWIVLEYYLERVKGTLELLDQLDLIGRTSEMAKLIGIQFYEVLSRGSQFRVESMMLRIAKPRNLVPLSPSIQQRAHMRAPEYLPLILEPQSRFYPDPVIVLDFQSLYPSMIMAYNYCFSTCLGRVEHLGQSLPFEFGASQLRTSPTLLRKLVDNELITISPCGVVYVKREVREGILPRMLSEVLDTRQMVKQSMKLHKSSTALQRILHSRQLGLKLIANVTYGYTAANFSGRMPCVEVGDSVVAKGRETLERAIKLVEASDKWNVKVVYGDTDSLFVLVPGRSRSEAFKIGAEIAELVTQDNPQPVKLKLEKVYQPCILQTKKRYVGYMYESPDQEEPIYEAKGIETVRRDGCPAAAKMLEKCLKILFEHADVSRVKSYVCRQFTKLLSGKANIQDLIFAKEFRGLNGYKPTACVPALELTRKWMQSDPRKIPRRGERVPFIVTNGPPGLPLIRLVRSPHDVLADEGLKINAIYYITKAIIPPLNRCFLLIGADVNEWFTKLPRKILFTPALSNANELIATTAAKKSTISQYFSSTNCLVDCGRQTKQGICAFCSMDTVKTVVTLQAKISNLERSYYLTEMICQACCGRPNAINCASLDCPVLYVHGVKRRQLSQIVHIRNILKEQY